MATEESLLRAITIPVSGQGFNPVPLISGRAMSGTGLNPWPDTGMVIARSKLSSVAIFAGGTLILYLSHYAKHSVDHVSVIRFRVRARSKWFLSQTANP